MRRVLGVTAVITAAFALAAPAFGAPVTKTLDFPLQGNSTTTIFSKSFDCCHIDVDDLGVHSDINGGIDLSMKATMNEGTKNDLTFTDTNLRQGKTLDLTNSLSNPSGTLAVNYMFSGHLSVYGIGFDINKDEGASMSCGLPIPSGSCSKDTNVEVLSFKPIDILVGYVKVSVDAVISTHAALDDTGLTSHRTLTIDSTTDVKPPTDLTFTSVPQSVDESVKLSCDLPANAIVNYAMGDESSAVNGTITEGIGVGVSGGAYLFNPIPGSDDILLVGVGPFNLPDLVSLPPLTMSTVNLSAPAQNADLGTLLPNNVAPTATMDAIPANGIEGTPIQLKVKGTGPGGSLSPCGDDSLDIVWSFDDGGVAFGKTVNHTFNDNLAGNPAPDRSGKVVITDPTGLKKTLNFAVPVANVNPTVGGGPDKTSVWGVPVSFHANGQDAGAVDNGSLLYTWDFGDPDSPVGGVGQDTSHGYANPGSRTAVVTVKDKDGGTGTSAVSVSITRRGSTTGYTGPATFIVTDAATLRAAVSDNTSAGAVAGRTVEFYDGATLIATGTTGNNGVASATYAFPLGSVGGHTITAKFGGDSLYTGSQSAAAVAVVKNPSVLTYTGVLTSSPSKAGTLTAKLTDDLARPLVGKTVSFQLGSQGCSGVTAANGTVSCTIAKLTQNPGKYPLSAQFGGDADYVAVGINGVFTIGK